MINVKSTLDIGPYAIPADEAANCIYLRRNHDIMIGPDADLLFHMQYAGHYIVRKEFHIRRRMVESAILLLTLGGDGELIYSGRVYQLTRGSCMLLNCADFHEYYPRDDGWEFKFIHFLGGMSSEYIGHIVSRSGPVTNVSGDSLIRMENALDRVLERTGSDVVEDYPEISLLIYSMLTLLYPGGRADEGEPSSGTAAMTRAVLFIRRSYAENISTEDIAREVNLSRPYMSDLFMRTFGMPPHEYVTTYRLSIVKDMLANTQRTVSEIAASTGFRDVSSLSRVFKRRIGISPVGYRQKYRSFI